MKQYRDLSRLNIDRHANEEDEELEGFYKDVMSPVQKPRTIDEIKEEEKSDTFAFIMLGFLYFVQGLPLGFFDNSLTFIFTEKGASFTDLSKLSLIMYPYSIKFLFAPLEDSVYFPFFGKRKSYIVPALVIAGTGLLIVSFYIEGMINNMQIDLLVVIGLIFVSLMALQDIAVDGWIVTLISPRNYSVAAAFQKIMVSIGYFTAFNLFIPLNSVDFCNKYLYSIPSDTPLFTFDGFCIGAGVLTLAVGLSLAFYEEKAPRQEHIVTFTEVYYMFRKLVLNKFLRRFVILLLLSHVNLRPVTGIFEPLMIQKGFKKEDLTNIKTVVVPFQILSIIYAAYLNKKQRNELFLFSFSTLILTFVNIFAFWILNSYDSLSYAKLSLLLGFQECLWGGLAWFANGSLSAYILNVTHESAASTFITTMYSINNFSGKWPETIALAIREVVSSNAIIIFSFVFGIIYAPLLFKYFVPLQNKTAFDFGFHKETLQSPPRSRGDSFNFETQAQVNIKYQPIPS